MWNQVDEVVKMHIEKKNAESEQDQNETAQDHTDQEPPTEVISKLLFTKITH